MHEYSIIQSLLDLCESHAQQHHAKGIKKVVVAIGVLSGVEPQLLKSAYDVFRQETLCHDALLEIIQESLEIECLDCGQISSPIDMSSECHHCHGMNTRVIKGKDLYLMQLELDVDE